MAQTSLQRIFVKVKHFNWCEMSEVGLTSNFLVLRIEREVEDKVFQKSQITVQ